VNPRYFDLMNSLSHPVTRGIVVAIVGLLILAPILIFGLRAAGKLADKKFDELKKRTYSWYVLVALILLPVLAAPVPLILAVTALSLFCFREYARATGLHRERLITALVAVGILLVAFAALDNWYNLYAALAPLVVCVVAAAAILPDQPKGYTQRVALGIFGFMFFGYGLGYMGFMANDPNYRPIVLMIVLTTELNDVFAYIWGNLVGKRKLSPNTSPNKTMGGAIGALVTTTALVMGLGSAVFHDSALDRWYLLLPLGLIVGAVGQLGDLMLSSIKRDVGVKDLGASIPGHGGFLDRFDSLVLVTPVVFHFVAYYVGFALDEPIRIISGG
jgi:phosphatidate cytidylyltransferase